MEKIGGETLSIKSNMIKTTKILENMKNYDAEQFSLQLLMMVRELDHFYSTLVPQQGSDPSRTFYNIKPKSKRPKAGQVAYFNLRRGYPKELYDGHWCYVLRDFKAKLLIVPLTSVKVNDPIGDYEIEIEIKNFINDLSSRLQITDLRFIDAQRINEKQNVYDVSESLEAITKKVLSKLTLQDLQSVVSLT